MKEFLKTKYGRSGIYSILFTLGLLIAATSQLGNEELYEANGLFVIMLMVAIPAAAFIFMIFHTLGTYNRWKKENKWK